MKPHTVFPTAEEVLKEPVQITKVRWSMCLNWAKVKSDWCSLLSHSSCTRHYAIAPNSICGVVVARGSDRGGFARAKLRSSAEFVRRHPME